MKGFEARIVLEPTLKRQSAARTPELVLSR